MRVGAACLPLYAAAVDVAGGTGSTDGTGAERSAPLLPRPPGGGQVGVFPYSGPSSDRMPGA